MDNPLIFIGTGRCGSTVISNTVMAHEELAYQSNYQEILYPFPQASGIRNLFQNKFWNIKARPKNPSKLVFKPIEAYRMWNYLAGDEHNFSHGFMLGEKANEKRKVFAQGYFSTMCRFQKKEKIAVKITGPSRISFLLSLFPNAKFVLITRAFLPTLRSLLKVDYWQNFGVNQLLWKGGYSPKELELAARLKGNDALYSAFQLNKVIESTKQEIQEHKPDILTIAYEDFVYEPKKITKKILAFAGLKENSPACNAYLKALNVVDKNVAVRSFFNDDVLTKIEEIRTGQMVNI